MIGLIARVLRGQSRFLLAVTVWIVVATVVVLMQHMWWEYHFLLVLFPLGILATVGFEEVIIWVRQRRTRNLKTAIIFLLAVCLCPYILRLSKKALQEHRAGSRQAFRMRISPPYADAVAEANWVSSQPAGRIYVLGDPLIYYLAGQPQPISLNGWSPEWLLPDQWEDLRAQLSEANPRYIFVAAGSAGVVQSRGEAFARLLASDFQPVHSDDAGTWYARHQIR